LNPLLLILLLIQKVIHDTSSTEGKKMGGDGIKKAKNAWQFFLDDNRARLVEKAAKMPNSAGHVGKMVMTLASEEWRQLKDKSHYENLAREDSERVREFKEAAGISHTRKRKSDLILHQDGKGDNGTEEDEGTSQDEEDEEWID